MNLTEAMSQTWQWVKSRMGGGREKLKTALVTSDPTHDYRAMPYYASQLLVQELPPYTLFMGRLMLDSDPIVQFSLNVRNAALMVAEVDIKARNPGVQKWLEAQWNTLWELHRNKILAAKKWGFAGVQPTYRINPTTHLLDIDGLKDFAPHDVRALQSNGKICGFRVKDQKLMGPRAMWLSFEAEYGSPYGRGTLRRSYPPWYEKWMRHGAQKLIQQRMIKDAYIGDIFWFPPGLKLELPDGSEMSWLDALRQVSENRLSGSAYTLPLIFDDKGNRLVEYQPPQSIAGATDVFTWRDGLDEQILRGADVPIEVVKASETGSGYSGRSIPFMVLLSVCNGEFIDYCKQIEELLRQVAWLNFGGDPEFEIKPKSLVESFAGDAAGSPMGGGAIGGQPGQRPGMMQPQQQFSPRPAPQGRAVQFDESPQGGSTLDEITAIGTAAARRRIKTAAQQIVELAQKKTAELNFEGLGKFALLNEMRGLIEDLHRGVSSDLQASMLAAHFGGAAEVAVSVPPVFAPPPAAGDSGLMPPPAPPVAAGFMPDEPGGASFPIIDEAVRVLQDANVFVGDDFRQTAEAVRQGAFAITADLGTEQVAEIRDLLAENLERGPDVDAFVKAVQDRLTEGGPLSERHIETIFRTNVAAAFSDGANKSLEQPMVADAFPYRQYWATTDQRVRKEHKALETAGLNGTNIYRADDPAWLKFRPPWDFNSVLPDTVIEGRVLFASKANYSGKVFELTTKGGRRCTVTANHPILTSRGFVAAEMLAVGDNLLSNCIDDDGLFLSPLDDVDHPPTRIDEIFDSLGRLSGRITVKTVPLDLHGDAKYGNGEVEIVAVNCELLDDIKSHLRQGSRHFRFAASDLNDAILAAGRAATQFPGVTSSTSNGIPGFGQMQGAIAVEPIERCFGAGSRLEASRFELGVNRTTRDATLFADLENGFPAVVVRDQLVDIKTYHYDGPVYDVQTSTGYMLANGIVESNCRCAWNPVTVEQAARQGVQEAIDWLERAKAVAKERGGNPVVYLNETAPVQREWVAPPPFEPSPEFVRQ